MSIEVEQKFPVSDRPALERQLAVLGAEGPATLLQVDCYFAHPTRDFSCTDEALRLRQTAECNYITYKGPRLDAVTKTRQEIEVELAPGTQAATDIQSLLQALGFAPVAEVRKRRVHFTLCWEDRRIGVSLDDVDEVGNFVELEIIASEPEMDAARRSIASLAGRLGLSNGERRSYLELLLDVRGRTPPDRRTDAIG